MSLTRFDPAIVIQQDGVQKVANPDVIDFRGDVTVTEDPEGTAKVVVTTPTTLGNQEFQALPYMGDDSNMQSLSFGAVTALSVIVCACRLDSLTIADLTFRITSGAASQLMAMGIYDRNKALIAETGWLSSASIGNKTKSGLSAVQPLETGWIAYARSNTTTTGIIGASFSAAQTIFLNAFADGFLGTAANAASSGSAGDPAMPATLGAITPFSSLTFFPFLLVGT